MNAGTTALIVSLTLMATWPFSSAADDAGQDQRVRVFQNGDLAQIRAEHDGRAFVLMAWSLDCLPCHRKLSRMRPVLEANPDWRLVLIAVDDPARAAETRRRITEYRLETVDHWRFADQAPALLRRALDPHWFGELPRSWLFDAAHRVRAISGVMPDEVIEQHFSEP